MNKSIKELSAKAIKNINTIKGGNGDDDDWGVDDLGTNVTPKKISGKG